MENLKRAKICRLKKIFEIGKNKPAGTSAASAKQLIRPKGESFPLAELIRSSGFYRSKSKYLIEIAQFVVKNNGIQKLRKWPFLTLRKALLHLKGIGPETADSILLYALDKPVFVIDEYTRRLVKKLRLTRNFSYESLQKLFEKNLPQNFRLFQDFHALIVIEQQCS
jgi:endonuclease-3 related protein